MVNSRPDMSLSDKAGVVASPVATGPAGTLIQELDVVLQGRLDLALLVILNPGLPLVGNQPPGHKVVIIGIELKLAPALSLEAMEEQGALKDFRSEGTGAS